MEKRLINGAVTYDYLDKLSDAFAQAGLSTEGWYPSLEDIENYIEPNVEKNLDFIYFIIETAGAPTTNEEKEARTLLMSLFSNNIKILDTESDFNDECFLQVCRSLKSMHPYVIRHWNDITAKSNPNARKGFCVLNENNELLDFSSPKIDKILNTPQLSEISKTLLAIYKEDLTE